MTIREKLLKEQFNEYIELLERIKLKEEFNKMFEKYNLKLN